MMYEIKLENVDDDFSKYKETFDFSNHFAKSKYYNESDKLVLVYWRMKEAWLLLKT